MKMYRLTTEEIVMLISKEMGERAKFNPVKDVNGNYFISEVEHEICGCGTEAEFVPLETEPLI